MVEQRQSAMQRIQVGLVGLVVVLLFVTLANMVLDGVSDGQSAGGRSSDDLATTEQNATPDEPLAELGVTPVAKDDQPDETLASPAQNIRQVPGTAPKQ